MQLVLLKNVFYKNKIFELKDNLYNKVFTVFNNNYQNTIVNYILENCENVPNQFNSYYYEWLKGFYCIVS